MAKNIKLVIQKHDMGCGPACISMITGRDYDEVTEDFGNDFNEGGMTTPFMMEYMYEQGYSCILKEVEYKHSRDFGKDELLTPFAPYHILAIKQYADSEHGHFIVMDKDGKLFCPSGNTQTDILNFYQFTECVGLWPLDKIPK